MSLQTYVCLQAVQDGSGFHDRGQTIQLDDALAATQAMLSAKTIELQSSPSAAADLAASQARAAWVKAHGMEPEQPFAANLEGDQLQTDFGDHGGQELLREKYNSQ